MNRVLFVSMVLFYALIIIPISSSFAQQDNLKSEADKVLQNQEKLTNESISKSYSLIGRLQYLANEEVHNPSYGMKLKINKQGDLVHFKLKGHKFRENFDREMIGFTQDALTITFQNKKLVRVERIFYRKTFSNEQSLVLRIVDQKPDETEHNNILISRTENGQTLLRSKFGVMKNTAGNPYRIKLKNAYSTYLKDLLFVLNRIAFETEKYKKAKNRDITENFPSLLSD